MAVETTTYTFDMDEDLKQSFEKKSSEDHRSMAGQLRFLMEAYTEGKIEIK